jgi:GntR family transcriptional repressor for pyruvate dehydrogenase complex
MSFPLRAKKLTEIIIDEIKVLIESDRLKPGDKIPTEQELMRIFKVSRTSIREALSVLKQEGLIDIIQGRGTFLKKHYTPLPDINDPSSDGMASFMEARKILECNICALAAERATDEDFDIISKAVERLEADCCDGDDDQTLQADLDFHYSVARAARNQVLFHLLQEVDGPLQKGRAITISFPQGKKKALEGHERILNAIRNRSSDDAFQQMAKHIEEIGKAQQYIVLLQDDTNRLIRQMGGDEKYQ